MRSASCSILSVACLALIGCKTATGVKPVMVEVRDSDTHQPVEGASVSAATAYLFVPYDPSLTKVAGWFDKNPRERTFATTDSGGAAMIDIMQDCPVKVVIARAGYEPFETILGGHPMSWETDEWIDPDEALGSNAGPRLQARFVAELSKSAADQ